MQPIGTISGEEARGLRAFLFDLDDTLLDHGRLTERAYAALFRLKESGLVLVAVTGRPSGWGEVLARQWPVDGVVAENGAITCARNDGHVDVIDFAGTERASRARHLGAIVGELRDRFPTLRPTDDMAARRADFTFDIGERERVTDDVIAAACSFASARGARTSTSSVHLHVTLDGLDKASGVARFLSERFGFDETALLHHAAFIGDSENDEACFSAFHTTIAVANLRGRPTVAPRYVTKGERGTGFAEAAGTVVARRGRTV